MLDLLWAERPTSDSPAFCKICRRWVGLAHRPATTPAASQPATGAPGSRWIAAFSTQRRLLCSAPPRRIANSINIQNGVLAPLLTSVFIAVDPAT